MERVKEIVDAFPEMVNPTKNQNWKFIESYSAETNALVVKTSKYGFEQTIYYKGVCPEGRGYFFARHVFNGPPFISTDGTMQQLKNAGNLRLVKNENIINKVLAYDASVKELREWDESDTRIRTTFREIGGLVFNADQLYKAMDSNFKFVRSTTNPQLITQDPITINNVAFQIKYISLSSLGNSQRGKALKEKAEKLIELLNKEYHLQ